MPFDREAVLSYSDADESVSERRFEKVEAARTELSSRKHWSLEVPVGRTRGEVDQLAVDPRGSLVLIELKNASASPDSVYYSPLQLLSYVWEWHTAYESVREGARRW